MPKMTKIVVQLHSKPAPSECAQTPPPGPTPYMKLHIEVIFRPRLLVVGSRRREING
jgi:hypothetical protein